MSFSPQLTLARRHTQPAAAYIARLTATATFAYVLALYIPAGTSRPVLAPLTALLVLQASLFKTVRSGIKRVISVTAGVLAAVTLSGFVDFNWWLLGLLIGGTLVVGHMLRLGDDMLEVPISAMLIFSSVGTHAAATGRVVDTLVGTVAGLAGGLLFAPLRVQTAREAVADLAGQLAALLDQMAADLGDEPEPAQVSGWLTRARGLFGEIERVDDTLRQAEDSARLNPRALRQPATLPDTEGALRGGLETLEHATLSLRFLARSVSDATRMDSDASPVREADTRAHLAAVLTMLAAALRSYGRMARTLPYGSEAVKSALTAELDAALQLQDRLAVLLDPRSKPGDEGAAEWPLRGEILSHVDRLRADLAAEPADPGNPAPRAETAPADPADPAAGSGRHPRAALPGSLSLARPLARPPARPLAASGRPDRPARPARRTLARPLGSSEGGTLAGPLSRPLGRAPGRSRTRPLARADANRHQHHKTPLQGPTSVMKHRETDGGDLR